MIRYLKLRDFRAFKAQSFQFSKLNIFVGRNNSGKSSALSALNVIAQTIAERGIDGTPLLLNGLYDKLGTFIDVVHGNRANRPMSIELGFDRYDLKLEFKYRTQRKEIELQRFDLADKGKTVFSYLTKKDSFDTYIGADRIEELLPDMRKRRPTFRNFWPIQITTPLALAVRSPEAVDDRQMRRRRRVIEAQRTLSFALRQLEEYFENFDSVSASRDRPQRTYLYSGESARQVGTTGSSTAQVLSSDSSRRGSLRRNLVEGISEWLRITDIAQGLYVRDLTSRHYELCIISNDNSEHNICDVGFGCSQVLPVLTAGLNLFSENVGSEDRVLIVQEPEIHLHPNAQAALGSFFVNLVQSEGQVFIETHSDNLVLRIARHVALGQLDASDVSIFYVSEEQDRRVIPIEITTDGQFKPDWPGGFFPQRQQESFELAKAAAGIRPRQASQLSFFYPEAL